jgi:predicted negative regulator of RcsB-dependent stress response
LISLALPLLIGLSQFRSNHIMAADLQESSAPLAEISQGPNAFEQFLDRNQKGIIIASIVLALGVVAFVIYQGIEKSRQETAGAALIKAEDLAALQSVVNDHGDTHAARSAMLLLADRQWTEGQQDTAIETLRKFISASPEHPAIPSAQASLGSKLMIQGKSADAAKVFQELVDDPKARYIAPYALISLGDISKAAGDLDKAEATYKRIKSDFPDSSFADSAGRRLATLKAKPPVQIDPPPAPPKPETTPAPDATGAIPPSPQPGIEVKPVTPPQEPSLPPSNEKPAEVPVNPEP